MLEEVISINWTVKLWLIKPSHLFVSLKVIQWWKMKMCESDWFGGHSILIFTIFYHIWYDDILVKVVSELTIWIDFLVDWNGINLIDPSLDYLYYKVTEYQVLVKICLCHFEKQRMIQNKVLEIYAIHFFYFPSGVSLFFWGGGLYLSQFFSRSCFCFPGRSGA